MADLHWTRPDWLAEAVAWIRERVEVTGESRDAGVRLRELLSSVDDLVRWDEALPEYAELQLAVAPHATRLLALGVPDERLAGFADRFALLLATHGAVMLGHPDGLTPHEHVRLLASVPEVARLCTELAAYGIPETIQHDDLHDGNVFVRDGRYLFFDWGDACVTHPFHTLVVTLRAIAHRHDVEPGSRVLLRLRDAYLEPFFHFGRPTDLVAAAELALRVGTIGRAHAWHRMLQSIEPELRSGEADAVPYGLKLFLANGPIGSSR
jgi:hypothetical protein